MAGLEVTTRVGCRVDCSYCPQSAFVTKYSKHSQTTLLTMDTLMHCVDKVVEGGATDHASFSGFSEPFLNPDCASMIEYCANHFSRVSVFTTMVGVTSKDIDRLRDVQCTWIVHIPDNRRLTKITVDDSYLSLLDKLTTEIPSVRFTFTHGAHLFEYPHPKVLEFLNRRHIRFANHLMHSRAGIMNEQGSVGFRIPGELIPCRRLRENVLLPNGDVVLCCQDFGQKHVLGNLLKTDYPSLFLSDEYKKIEQSLKDPSIDSLCRFCVLYSFPKNRFVRLWHNFSRRYPAQARLRLLSMFNKTIRYIPSSELRNHIDKMA